MPIRCVSINRAGANKPVQLLPETEGSSPNVNVTPTTTTTPTTTGLTRVGGTSALIGQNCFYQPRCASAGYQSSVWVTVAQFGRVLPFGTHGGAEPLGPFEDVGKVHPAAQLTGQHGLLLGLQL